MFYACFSLIFICWPFAGYLLPSLSKEIKSSILGLKCMFCARFSPVFICWPFANYGIPLNIINGFAFSTKDSDLSNKLIPHRDIISIFSHPLMFIVRANNHGFFSDLMNSCKTTHRCLSIERRKSMTCFHHYLYNIIEGYLMTAITHYCITRMIDCS